MVNDTFTPAEVEAICKDRFDGWTRFLVARQATPMIAIGVSHGENSGQFVLTVLNEPDFTPQVIAAILRQVADLADNAVAAN